MISRFDHLHLTDALEAFALLPTRHLGLHAVFDLIEFGTARLLHFCHALCFGLPRHFHPLQLLRLLGKILHHLLTRQKRILLRTQPFALLRRPIHRTFGETLEHGVRSALGHREHSPRGEGRCLWADAWVGIHNLRRVERHHTSGGFVPELVRSLQQSGKAGARIAREQLFNCGGSLRRGKDGIAPDDEERSRKVGKHLATYGNNVVEELQPFVRGGDVSKQRAEQLPRAPL